MSETAQRLKAEMANLSEEEREELAEFLWGTLDNGHEQAEIDAAWEAELMRREADILSGKAVGVPVDEAVAKLLEKYR